MSRYQARHAAQTPSRPHVRKLVAVAGLTTALGVPVAATPASAQTITTGNVPTATLATATLPTATVPTVSLPSHTVSSPSVALTSTVTSLRQGSRGPQVVALQQRLRVSADGIFGLRTRAAVVAFQRSHGLVADGIVGPITARALSLGLAASTTRTLSVSRTYSRTTLGARAVAEAASHLGQPYQYGAAGPSAFDCSGLVQYVFGRVGVSVPRTSAAQAAYARPVARSDRQPGDLIIMYSSGRVSHVGIYAGNDSWWVARHTGTTITRQALWTTAYSVGRFG